MLITILHILRKKSEKSICRRYAKSTSGLAAMEFALIFPVFLAIFYGTAEIANYNLIKRRAQMSVDFGVEFITRDDDNNMSTRERFNALDIWNITNPSSYKATSFLSGRRTNGFSRSFAGIQFNKTPAGCSGNACDYDPEVVWDFHWTSSDWAISPVKIGCSIEVVDNKIKLKGNQIPEGMLGRGALIVGHYTTRYKPLFESSFIPESDIHVYALRKTRGGNAIQHTPVKQC